jgi:hypothetical protein
MDDVVYFENNYKPTHLGCPAYPNCDINPLGCYIESGEATEWFGHKDENDSEY